MATKKKVQPKHGGARKGAGKPLGPATKQIRVYVTSADDITKLAKAQKLSVAAVVANLLIHARKK